MEKDEKKDYKGIGGLFIPGGLLVGMGVGFLVNNLPAGMFIGLGAGFVLFALTVIFVKK